MSRKEAMEDLNKELGDFYDKRLLDNIFKKPATLSNIKITTSTSRFDVKIYYPYAYISFGELTIGIKNKVLFGIGKKKSWRYAYRWEVEAASETIKFRRYK